MNNKGFAITGVLYSVLILFILILVSFLTVLNNKNTLFNATMDSVNNSLDMTAKSDINQNLSVNYTTLVRGKYSFTSKNCTAEIYLPAFVTIKTDGVNLVKLNDTVVNICTNSGNNNLFYFINIVSRSGTDDSITINNVITTVE